MPKLVEDVIVDLLVNGCDRGALVRPASETKEVAVAVILASKIAMTRLGKALLPVIEQLGDQRAAADTFGERSTIGEMFAAVDSAPNCWAGYEFDFGRATDVYIALFRGPICERVAEICTEHGAPCSLNPAQPALGYEIERRVTR